MEIVLPLLSIAGLLIVAYLILIIPPMVFTRWYNRNRIYKEYRQSRHVLVWVCLVISSSLTMYNYI